MTVVDAVPRAIADRVAELTLDEKIRLLEGHASWRTMGVERLGIPSLYLTDGPHGVRRTRAEDGAFGIAGKQLAHPGAMIAAIRMAGECASRRAAA